jgi:hypothetical protein
VFAFSEDPAANDVVGNRLPSCAQCNLSKSDKCLLAFVGNGGCADLDTGAAVNPADSLQPRVKRILFHSLAIKIARRSDPDIAKLVMENARLASERGDLPTFPLESVVPNVPGEEPNELGRGGQGRVVRGCVGSQPVAVKVIFDRASPEHRALLYSLDHPNIIRIIGQAKDRFSWGLVLELMDGDLATDPGRAFYAKRVPFNTLAILGALKYLHARCLIHRDVKPANILYHRAQQIVKLADFGLARNVTDNMTAGSGTASFRAPETRTGTYGTAADMFSFGKTMADVSNEMKFYEDKVMVKTLVDMCVVDNPSSRASAVAAFAFVARVQPDQERETPPTDEPAAAAHLVYVTKKTSAVFHTRRLCYGAVEVMARTDVGTRKPCASCSSDTSVYVVETSRKGAFHAYAGCYGAETRVDRQAAERQGRKPCVRCSTD